MACQGCQAMDIWMVEHQITPHLHVMLVQSLHTNDIHKLPVRPAKYYPMHYQPVITSREIYADFFTCDQFFSLLQWPGSLLQIFAEYPQNIWLHIIFVQDTFLK